MFIIHDKGLSTHYPHSIGVRFGIVKVGEDFSEAPLVLDAYGIPQGYESWELAWVGY
jgi:hypothetical protein